jgi:AMP deaminase
MEIKRHWLGHQWYLPGAEGNDINRVNLSQNFVSKFRVLTGHSQTNVPNIRLAYRHQTLVGELDMIKGKSIAGALPNFESSGAQAISGVGSH